MNTGEATDTFDFTFTGLPCRMDRLDGDPHPSARGQALQRSSRSPDANAPTGVYTLGVRGTSTTDGSVTSTCSFQVEVVRPDADRLHRRHESAVRRARRLRRARPRPRRRAEPRRRRPCHLRALRPRRQPGATATTDGSGVATANPLLTVLPGTYLLTVSTPSGKHAPASITVAYTVERRPTTIVYTGVHTAEYSRPGGGQRRHRHAQRSASRGQARRLRARDADRLGHDGRRGNRLRHDHRRPAGRHGERDRGLRRRHDLPSDSDTDPFVIDEEDLTFVYTGDTLVPLGTTPILRSQATQEADEFPGDLSLARARCLAPTLTSTPFLRRASAPAESRRRRRPGSRSISGRSRSTSRPATASGRARPRARPSSSSSIRAGR